MEILYHYCSTAAFYSIVSSRALWLSSLSLSSDSAEGKLVASAIRRLAIKDELDKHATDRLLQSVAGVESVVDGFGFCLSEAGDLLSQWRGYAQDGTGVAIGFSKQYLEKLAEASRHPESTGFTLQTVSYSEVEHEDHVRDTYAKVRELIDQGAFKIPGFRSLLDTRTDEEIEAEAQQIRGVYSRLSMTILTLFSELFLLKSDAFVEEREWRLLSYYGRVKSDTCLFRTSVTKLIPYRSFELKDLDELPITEILLGPKHETPVQVVEDILRQAGFGEVTVKKSRATYR